MLAAHDYLLSGEGRWQVGSWPGWAGLGSHTPGFMAGQQPRSPDTSSALEFIWVTVTGGVCCDKRLMGGALGSCLDPCRVGGRRAGLAPALPHGHPSLALLAQGRCWGFFCPTAPKSFMPALSAQCQLPGSVHSCLWAAGRWERGWTPGMAAQPRRQLLGAKMFFLQRPAHTCSCLIFMHQNETSA